MEGCSVVRRFERTNYDQYWFGRHLEAIQVRELEKRNGDRIREIEDLNKKLRSSLEDNSRQAKEYQTKNGELSIVIDELNTKLRSTLEDNSRQAKEYQTKNGELSIVIDDLNTKFNDCSAKLGEAECEKGKLAEKIDVMRIEKDALIGEIAQLQTQIDEGSLKYQQHIYVEELKEKLIQSKLEALQRVKATLKFAEQEKLDKLLVTIQLENGLIIYYDNVKPFELFTMIEFFKVSIVDSKMQLEQINELKKTTDLIPFENQPLYFIEESREWIVYQYHENYTEMDGKKFDISGLRSIRKFDCHYHRGILYFFRENTTAKLEKLNEKVVVVEAPVLDGKLSYYTPPHGDYIYVANTDQNILITLNTTNLHVAQHSYEPPIDSTYHSIVGVHDGILTMLFEGTGVGRSLMTTKLP